MANPVDALTISLNSSLTYSGDVPAVGDDFSPIQVSNTISSKHSKAVGTGASQANQMLAKNYTITFGSPTLTLDLTAVFTNIVNNAAATFSKIKGIRVRLLSATQDASGTACSSITVGTESDVATNVAQLFFGAVTGSQKIKNGGRYEYVDDDANGYTIDSTHKNLLITNNDGAVNAYVQIVLWGNS